MAPHMSSSASTTNSDECVLSDQLLALGRLARGEPPTGFLRAAVTLMGKCLRYRSAWWGLCFDRGPEEMPDIIQAEAIGLPESFAADWRRVESGNVFARTTVRERGVVQRLASACSGPAEATALAELARQLDIEGAMALCLEEEASGQLFFVVLYRAAGDQPFSDAEAAMFRELVRHVAQLWRFALQDALCQAEANSLGRMALARRDGQIVYAGSQISEQLSAHWPAWDGLQLPAEVVSQLQKAPFTQRMGLTRLVVTPLVDHLQLAIESADVPTGLLTPRERRVAHLFAQGMSYKVIAQQLSLSPATVRTYLRQAYLRLGVKTKMELHGALSGRAR